LFRFRKQKSINEEYDLQAEQCAFPHELLKTATAMTHAKNHLGQPIGFSLEDWQPPPPPPRTALAGRYCRVEPLDVGRHAQQLYEAYAHDAAGRLWTYLAYGPFPSAQDFRAWLTASCLGADPLFYAIVDSATGTALGVASYLRIQPAHGSIEVGHINYAPSLQRTRAATEAMYLMMQRAFQLGYRRYEWKCDALNAASRAAAQRLGLTFEGIFRQATVYKGRNRDTAWYAALDTEWPPLEAAFLRWLDPGNFGADGKQRSPLSELTAHALKHQS
jgi:RimJ/RimL family protein N-acetyltransferase